MDPRIVGGWTLAAAALVAVTAAPAAAGSTAAHPVNPLCQVTSPVEGVPPGQSVVCGTQASAEANATVGGYDGPCTQEYPASELCSETRVAVEAHADAAYGPYVCVEVDDLAQGCGPVLVHPQDLALP